MSRSRRRSIYCDPLDWAEIVDRAFSVGVNISPGIPRYRKESS
ncbi:MAG: hypothetical protein OXF88_14340 [Rhodobacteraceae bacterium]|nr:hypothetical protein [Paracoccaceae bacterium]MCY4140219.1 hypothetical protein [Paracoccaceae bacterium]